MCAHNAADNEVTEGHGQSSVNQQSPSSDLVNEEKHDRGEDNEESVLYSASNEVYIARETRHGEDVYDVVCVLG